MIFLGKPSPLHKPFIYVDSPGSLVSPGDYESEDFEDLLLEMQGRDDVSGLLGR